MRARPPALAALAALALAACGGGTSNGGAAESAAEDPAAHGLELELEDARREVCPLAGGAVRLAVTIPEGFALARTPESCMVAEEQGEVPLFVTLSAVSVDDAGPEQLLGEPEGVLQWVRATALLGPEPSTVGEGETRLLGQTTVYHRVVGSPQGLGVRREVALMTVQQASHHVIVMAMYEPGDDRGRARALALLRGITTD